MGKALLTVLRVLLNIFVLILLQLSNLLQVITNKFMIIWTLKHSNIVIQITAVYSVFFKIMNIIKHANLFIKSFFKCDFFCDLLKGRGAEHQ